jgi:hypothetical protein
MGKLLQLSRSRSFRGTTSYEAPTSLTELDGGLLPVAVLLFLASLARVVHAIWAREPFDTEPTFALVFVIGLPWLAAGWLRKERETR